MEFILQNHSSYPREDASVEAIPPSVATRPAPTCGAGRRQIMLDAVREQERLGLHVLTDGQLVWEDRLSSIVTAIDGVQLHPTGNLRAATYCPQLLVTAPLKRRHSVVSADFLLVRQASERPIKPVLPGPYTLARACVTQDASYTTLEDLAFAWGEIVAAEVADVAAAGALFIQIEEPAILLHPSDMRLLRRLLEPIWDARGGAQLVLATYSGDATALYAQLNSLPVDILALDLASSSDLGELIAHTGASKELGLGLIDGCNPQPEQPSTLARCIEKILKRYVLGVVHLLPSCGLHQLAPERARHKLSLLTEARQLLVAAA